MPPPNPYSSAEARAAGDSSASPAAATDPAEALGRASRFIAASAAAAIAI